MEQKAKLIKLLGCSEAEAEDIIKTDKLIDSGKRSPYDLPPEQEKAAKKFINSPTHKKPITFDNKPRKRKENPTKAGIIANLNDFLSKMSDFQCENLQILNPERQISFKIGENTYELTLIQKRNRPN